jgi:hypothetical protein
MMIRAIVVVLFCLFCVEAHSKGEGFLDMVSPKQRSFLRENPKALKTLSTVFAEAFATRNVQIYYFYSSDKTRPIASHYYPTDSAVGIIIKAEQDVLDEYLCILYECINSHGEPRFKRLFELAYKGEIGRREYALEILKVEFEALGKMKELLKGLNVSKSLKEKSFQYKCYVDCPAEFSDFLEYKKKLHDGKEATESYEAQYDMLRKQ